MRPLVWGLLSLVPLLAVAGTGSTTPPETPPSTLTPATPGIRFLHLRLTTNQVHLERSLVVPGTLKSRRGAPSPEQILLTLLDAEGKPLWTERLPQPWITRLEYEDPDRPGELKTIIRYQSEALVVARVPALPQAQRLAVHRTLPRSDDAALANPATPLPQVLVGIIDLSPEVQP